MKLTEFMRGKWSFLAVNLLTAGAAAFLLYLVRAELYFSVFLPCFLFVGGICSLLPEYIGKRRYYRALQTLLAQLDRRYLLSELLEYPDFFEGQALCDALRAAGKSMNDEIAGYKRASAEYREYIELWVHEIKTPIAAAMLCAENSGASAVLEELEKIEGFVEQALFYARSSHVEKDYSIKETALAE
ncbi:MAG: sensor histidine kinase, partial [Oscillospiraceae bacterium]|nr:sensor histidine kinase [Oscillospiraceae bacterium]